MKLIKIITALVFATSPQSHIRRKVLRPYAILSTASTYPHLCMMIEKSRVYGIDLGHHTRGHTR